MCFQGPSALDMTSISTEFFGHVKTLTNSVVLHIVFESFEGIQVASCIALGCK